MPRAATKKPRRASRKAAMLAYAENLREHVQRRLGDGWVLPWKQAAEITKRPFKIVARRVLRELRRASKTGVVTIGDPREAAALRAAHEELSLLRSKLADARPDGWRAALKAALPYVLAAPRGPARKKLKLQIRVLLGAPKEV